MCFKLDEILVSCTSHSQASPQTQTEGIRQAIKEKKNTFGEWKYGDKPDNKDVTLVINKKLTTRNLRKL